MTAEEDNKTMGFAVRFAITAGLVILALSAADSGFAYQFQKVQAHSQAIPAPEARVDINAASPDELLKLPGMTRTWAARIIRFRPYRGKNDLLDRGVVTSAVYDRIKDYIIAHRAEK